ncbi:MAG: acyltransferase domain-containing protein, partial [Planctomycetota bacterium]|nr:acyltransferase domain-containing protein [Planctomycetota bacterium]
SSVRALSKSGQCRSFDADADGIVLGEGAGVIVIKRLDDAERDGDRIYAVLKGIAGSSDGKSLGLTAPRKEGQVRALRRAYGCTGVSPEDVGLMEAHGTGTVVGDRTELESMSEVFGAADDRVGNCALGSVKSNIGHTKCAAGMASLIKVVLALHKKVLPPTLNIQKVNSGYDREVSPFSFLDRACSWVAQRRVGALSAFGFGGTNFHAVVEEYRSMDDPESGLEVWPAELFLFSGKTRGEAMERVERLEEVLESDVPRNLRDLAAAVSLDVAQGDRVQAAVVARDVTDLQAKLALLKEDGGDRPGVFLSSEESAEVGKLAFLFPGQGSQRVGMLGDLFVAFPQLSSLLDLGEDWLDRIYPPQACSQEDRREQEAALTDTRVAQPALGMCDLAMARIFEELGLSADMHAGHSYGELAALCVAGAIRAEDLLSISEARGRTILDVAGDDPGTMAAVAGGAEEVAEALDGIEGVVLANHNAPRQTIISGPTASVEAALERLAQRQIGARKIPVACAFHSEVVADAQQEFAAVLDQYSIEPLLSEVWSNTTATPYPTDPAAVRSLLAKQLASPVLFAQQIEAMYEAGARVFVEVGPGRVLTGLVGKILGDREHVSVAPGEGGLEPLLLAVASLATSGVPIDASSLFRGRVYDRLDLDHCVSAKLSPLTWKINGQRATPLFGEPPEGAMLPVTSPPVELVPTGSPAAVVEDDKQKAVIDYLANLREMVEAQRQVMLAYLGASEVKVVAAEPVIEIDVDEQTDSDQTEVASASEAAVDVGPMLLEIVSERTGYPIEMLDLDQDLESDLSIDSIKRIEILGVLNDRSGLAAKLGGGDQDELVEELASIKTLRGIIEWLERHAGDVEEKQVVTGPVVEQASKEHAEPLPDKVSRFVFEIERVAPAQRNGLVLSDKVIALTRDDSGIAEVLAAVLEKAGARVHWASADTPIVEVDGLVHLASLRSSGGPEEVKALFRHAKLAVGGGAKWIIGVTGMGGLFGRASNGSGRLGQGG